MELRNLIGIEIIQIFKRYGIIRKKGGMKMDIRNLIGIEIMEQGKLLKVTDAAFEDENIVLTTETVEKDAKETKEKEVV